MANANSNPPEPQIHNEQQYLRKFNLVVFGQDFIGTDLSNLRFKFSVKKTDGMTPNNADIRVYNMSRSTATDLQAKLQPSIGSDGIASNNGTVILQAGYQGNYGVIFQGNIKQVILGRESATDTFIDIIAGDGQNSYNYAIINKTLAKGAKPVNQMDAASVPMAAKGITQGQVGTFTDTPLPRGKVMYGNSNLYMRQIAKDQKKTWSIQNQQITFVPLKSYLPGEQVFINSKSGMIGTPQQTTQGVNVKCLLNPIIKVGGLVNINEKDVAAFKIDLSTPNSAANIPAPFSLDGAYYVFCVEHNGDTRGVEWCSNLVTQIVSIPSNPANAIGTTPV